MTPRQSAAEIHALASQCYAMPVPAEQDIILFEPIITQAIADAAADLTRERDRLKADNERLEELVEWYALLARAVKADRLDWDEAEGFSWAGDDDLGDECEFKDGLPVETPELRAALEAALNQNRMPQ